MNARTVHSFIYRWSRDVVPSGDVDRNVSIDFWQTMVHLHYYCICVRDIF